MAAEKTAPKKKTTKVTAEVAPTEEAPVVEAVVETTSEVVEEVVETPIAEEKVETKTKEDEDASKVEEALEPVKELAKKIDEINESQKALESSIKKNPDDAVKLINEEIKKAEKLESEVKAILNKPIKASIGAPTTWWNGNGYDF